DLLPLGEILAANFGEPAPGNNGVPFGAPLLLAVAVLKDLVRGESDLRDCGPARCVLPLGVLAQPPDQHHFINGTTHFGPPSPVPTPLSIAISNSFPVLGELSQALPGQVCLM